MNISKTLFKTLTRCSNASALYNMYINRGYHDVKAINGIKIDTIEQGLNGLSDDTFNDLKDEEKEIFASMFDEETGEDLTIVTSTQLEAFREVFSDVELLAARYIEKLFNLPVISSKNTFEQKKFEYLHNGNKYYCYLDVYIENENRLQIFEVKSSSSRIFDALGFTVKNRGKKYPFFKMNENKINECLLETYLGQELDGVIIDEKYIENKIKTSLDRYSAVGKYIFDLSIERNFIENSFTSKGINIPKIDYYLVVLNHNYCYDGAKIDGKRVYNTAQDGEKLFKIYDMNFLSKAYLSSIDDARDKLEKTLEHLTIENNCLGKHCRYNKTDRCKFLNICFSPLLKEGSILEYTNRNHAFKVIDSKGKMKDKDMYELINNGIYTMEEASMFTPFLDQHIELDCFKKRIQYYDIENLKFLISKITYPIFHLDFESYNCPLPRYVGERPYTQSLFQYSLHIEKEPFQCDLEKDHYEYLAPDHLDHRRDLAVKLINDIDLSNGGTVLAYHADFEKTRIKELIVLFPDLETKLSKILNNIFDLEHIIHASEKVFKLYDPSYSLEGKPKFNFYDYRLHASFSIKKILPLFTDLSYSDLEVKNGTEAVLVYGLLPTYTPKEYEEKYLALRKYCRQDTWSMVKILQGIKNKIDNT